MLSHHNNLNNEPDFCDCDLLETWSNYRGKLHILIFMY